MPSKIMLIKLIRSKLHAHQICIHFKDTYKFTMTSFGMKFYCLFVCFESHEQIFSYLATVTITGDGAANLDQCLALTAFSSEGSFTCHTYCDTGPPFEILSKPHSLLTKYRIILDRHFCRIKSYYFPMYMSPRGSGLE
jgi:hypothetical protein